MILAFGAFGLLEEYDLSSGSAVLYVHLPQAPTEFSRYSSVYHDAIEKHL